MKYDGTTRNAELQGLKGITLYSRFKKKLEGHPANLQKDIFLVKHLNEWYLGTRGFETSLDTPIDLKRFAKELHIDIGE